MSDEPDMSQDKNTLLFLMSNISPKVREGLETESYRNKADSDGSTMDFILEEAFANLMVDLATIGLNFDIEPADYIDDSNKLSKFIRLLHLILPNTLYETLKTDHKVRTTLETISSGAVHDTMTIRAYLSEIAGLDGTPPLLEGMTDFIDQLYPLVTQTPVFSDYIKNVLELLDDERPATPTDPERHQQYTEFLKGFIGDLSDAVNLFEGRPVYNEILNIQQFIIQDLISPIHFVDYAYLFLESKDELPEELHEGFDRKWLQYFVSHPWWYDYYRVRDLEKNFTETWQTIAVCFAYALARGKHEDFDVLVQNMRDRFTTVAPIIHTVNQLWFRGL